MLNFRESVYIDTNTKLDFLCNKHGKQTNFPKYIIQGIGCKLCSPKSVGEETISSILTEMNISFTREYKFNDCRGVGGLPLRFDFAMDDTNVLIEFDGQQHFIEVSGAWKGTTEVTRKHDIIKNNYCANNGIELFRIPYFKQSKIREILLHLRRCNKLT